MDNSTENVTLFAVFLKDILRIYEDRKEDYMELFEIVEGYDISDPFAKIPITVYNDMCNWIEENLGKFNLVRVGKNVGESAFTGMQQNNMLPDSPTPHDVMKALVVVAQQMIQDPKNRGWEILEVKDKSILMRRTQTFNSKLQIGLLSGLLTKTQAYAVTVDYTKSIEKGDPFDEYLVSWR